MMLFWATISLFLYSILVYDRVFESNVMETPLCNEQVHKFKQVFYHHLGADTDGCKVVGKFKCIQKHVDLHLNLSILFCSCCFFAEKIHNKNVRTLF